MDKLVAARIIAFILTWINSFLVKEGLQPLPLLSEESIAYGITFVISVWTLATNNQLKKEDKQ